MPLPADSEAIGFLLVQICKLHRARAHALLEELGLYQGQPPVLFALWEQEGLTHGELAARLNIQPATMTKMIQRMERAGFIERRADSADERVSRVYLTEAGRAIQTQVKQAWRRLEVPFSEQTQSPQRFLYFTTLRSPRLCGAFLLSWAWAAPTA